MKVDWFAPIEPISNLDCQLKMFKDLSFEYADVTNSHSSGSLVETIKMTVSISLDSNLMDIKRLFEKNGLAATAVFAHTKLIDPSNLPNAEL